MEAEEVEPRTGRPTSQWLLISSSHAGIFGFFSADLDAKFEDMNNQI